MLPSREREKKVSKVIQKCMHIAIYNMHKQWWKVQWKSRVRQVKLEILNSIFFARSRRLIRDDLEFREIYSLVMDLYDDGANIYYIDICKLKQETSGFMKKWRYQRKYSLSQIRQLPLKVSLKLISFSSSNTQFCETWISISPI